MLKKFPPKMGAHHTKCQMMFLFYTLLKTVALMNMFLMSCDFAALLWQLLGVPRSCLCLQVLVTFELGHPHMSTCCLGLTCMY